MRTSNPLLNEKTFNVSDRAEMTRLMTLEGTAFKSAFLLLLTLGSAGYTWHEYFRLGGGVAGAQQVFPFMIGGAIVGFIVALISMFAQRMTPFLAPVYAVAEGLFLGALSATFQERFPGSVPLQAVLATFGTFSALLIAYITRFISATENFKLGMFAAMGGIMLMYLASMILGFFGIPMPFLHDSGPIGIGVSVVIVIVAALNLVLDFDFIEEGVTRGAPKYMEWYAAMGLLMTLVWLYVELLRLFAKLSKRD